MRSTYIGMLKDEVNDVKTMVCAADEAEARALVLHKFKNEFGMDFNPEDVEIRLFAQGDGKER